MHCHDVIITLAASIAERDKSSVWCLPACLFCQVFTQSDLPELAPPRPAYVSALLCEA